MKTALFKDGTKVSSDRNKVIIKAQHLLKETNSFPIKSFLKYFIENHKQLNL